MEVTTTPQNEVDYRSLVRPRPGHRHAGDATVVVESGKLLWVAIVDVLGHGEEAHVVAVQATNFLDRCLGADPARANPAEVLRDLHAVLKGTRGAAAGVCLLDTKSGLVRYAGVGNTVARCLGRHSSRFVSADGIVGGNMPTPREHRLTMVRGDTLLMYTDGVQDRFELADYPQLPLHNAETIVRTVIQRFGKDHDDAACIAVRYRP